MGQERVNKRNFITWIATRSEVPARVVTQVYEALLIELIGAIGRGETIVLTGFGRFYRQDHKGHKVRFGRHSVQDYSVLKFSASRNLNRRLDDPDEIILGDDDRDDDTEPMTGYFDAGDFDDLAVGDPDVEPAEVPVRLAM